MHGYTYANDGNGVFGFHAATAGNGIGVCGCSNSETGYGVYCLGGFAAAGTKNAVIPTSQGQRLLYALEIPEVWFEDFGEGKLTGGKARVELDPLFLETVTINDSHPLKVFIQLNNDCNGVYVRRQAAGFVVKELQGGTSCARFTYRVVAKRKNFESARLEACIEAPKLAALLPSRE